MFVLALFDKDGNVTGTEKFSNYDCANLYGKDLVELGFGVTFKVEPFDVPIHGTSISVNHW